MFEWARLPKDMYYEILRWLPFRDILALGFTDHFHHNAVFGEGFWKVLWNQHRFPLRAQPVTMQDFNAMFRRHLSLQDEIQYLFEHQEDIAQLLKVKTNPPNITPLLDALESENEAPHRDFEVIERRLNSINCMIAFAQTPEPPFHPGSLEFHFLTRLPSEWVSEFCKHHPQNIGHNLYRLDFSRCYLRTLPSNIELLQGLMSLNLYNNRLTSFPATFVNLEHLTNFYTSDTHFPNILDTLVQIPSLQWVSLCNLGIKSIPVSIKQLHHLKELYLLNNELEDLPDELALLPKLKYMPLSGNKLLNRTYTPAIEQMFKRFNMDKNYFTQDLLDPELDALIDELDKLKISANP